MSRVRITQIRSSIDRNQKQKRTLQALGLRKINGSVEHELTDTIQGMINKVSHLVEVNEVDPATENRETRSAAKPTPVSTAAVAVETSQEEE